MKAGFNMRHYSLTDSACLAFDNFLRIITGNLLATENTRAVPVGTETEINPVLSCQEKKQVAGFMRVNYTGEICAQALYQGQALTTRNQTIRYALEKAGLEERDHLYWCQSRLSDLQSRVSYLNPLWYGGAFLLGAIAGRCGDKWNLGFLAETEKQVVRHLDSHLKQLPVQDTKTYAILSTMRVEESHHADTAIHHGAAPLPVFLQRAMQFSAKLMTTTAYWC